MRKSEMSFERARRRVAVRRRREVGMELVVRRTVVFGGRALSFYQHADFAFA